MIFTTCAKFDHSSCVAVFLVTWTGAGICVRLSHRLKMLCQILGCGFASTYPPLCEHMLCPQCAVLDTFGSVSLQLHACAPALILGCS